MSTLYTYIPAIISHNSFKLQIYFGYELDIVCCFKIQKTGLMNLSLIGFVSLNCKGLDNRSKRKNVFLFLRKKSASILLLQETHSTEQSERYWGNEWGFKDLFSHGSANSRGTCINRMISYNSTFYANDENIMLIRRQILMAVIQL